MTIRVSILTLVLLSLAINATPQNLVKNPGFEEFISCDNQSVDIKGWLNDGGDFINKCFNVSYSRPPHNRVGYQYPLTGEGYAAILVYDGPADLQPGLKRQYLQGELKTSLKQKRYHVSFFANQANISRYSIWQLGVHFYQRSSFIKNDHKGLNLKNHVLNKKGNYISDTVKWVEITGTYRAKGKENHLIIGNFFDDDQTDTLFSNQKSNAATYINVDNVSVIPYPDFSEDTLLCKGDTLQLYANISDASFVWQDGSSDTVFTVTKPGTYWVKVVTEFTSFKDTIHVQYMNDLNLIEKDTVKLCQDDSISFDAATKGATSYLWSTGSIDPELKVNEGGWYWVEISNVVCSYRDSVFVKMDTLEVNLGNDTTVCENSEFILKVNQPSAKYLWQDSLTSQSHPVSQPGKYWVTVEKNGCKHQIQLIFQ